MKVVLLILLLGVLQGLASPIEYGSGPRKYKIVDKLVLQRQRDILRLFRYINQDVFADDLREMAGYSIESNLDAYTDTPAVKQFITLYNEGLLPRGEIFSIFTKTHLQQAIGLFKLFYYARDFDTLYKTAVWARSNVNEGMFLYSFSTALVQRQDTYTYILPPIYEVYPHYFFPSEVIQKVQNYKQQLWRKDLTEQAAYNVFANYSGHYLNLQPEQSLSYFLEDIGINSFYYYCSIYYPFWLGGEGFKLREDRRGEQYYYLYQQLLARYYMERLSNGLGEIEFFDYEQPFETGFTPSLRYPNGLEFPSRPNFARLSEYFYNYGQSWTFKSRYGYAYTRVREFERRFRDSVDSGFIFSDKGKLYDLYSSDQTDVLGNIAESNPDSLNRRFYGAWQIYARHLLGYGTQPLDQYKLAPSALEHFETALRDPGFYQLYKRMLLSFIQYKSNLPSYTYNELNFLGVTVEKIDFDRLITYFDNFDSDLNNAIYVNKDEYEKDNVKISVTQKRLNHKPFSYRLTINSESETDAVVRMYLGPKYDEYGRKLQLNQNRINFVELDIFNQKLKAGSNVIERNSRQLYWFVPDRTSYRDLYRRVMGAIEKGTEFQVDASEAFYGFPTRYLLPKGKREGQAFQIYVIVNPYKQPAMQKDVKQEFYFHKVGTGMNYIDNYSFGFPLDRMINKSEFKVPNSKMQEVVIFHRDLNEMNLSTLNDQEQQAV